MTERADKVDPGASRAARSPRARSGDAGCAAVVEVEGRWGGRGRLSPHPPRAHVSSSLPRCSAIASGFEAGPPSPAAKPAIDLRSASGPAAVAGRAGPPGGRA